MVEASIPWFPVTLGRFEPRQVHSSLRTAWMEYLLKKPEMMQRLEEDPRVRRARSPFSHQKSVAGAE